MNLQIIEKKKIVKSIYKWVRQYLMKEIFQKASTDLKKQVGEAGCSFSILTFPFKIQERMRLIDAELLKKKNSKNYKLNRKKIFCSISSMEWRCRVIQKNLKFAFYSSVPVSRIKVTKSHYCWVARVKLQHFTVFQ